MLWIVIPLVWKSKKKTEFVDIINASCQFKLNLVFFTKLNCCLETFYCFSIAVWLNAMYRRSKNCLNLSPIKHKQKFEQMYATIDQRKHMMILFVGVADICPAGVLDATQIQSFWRLFYHFSKSKYTLKTSDKIVSKTSAVALNRPNLETFWQF